MRDGGRERGTTEALLEGPDELDDSWFDWAELPEVSHLVSALREGLTDPEHYEGLEDSWFR